MDECFAQSDRQRFVMDQFIKKLLVIIATTSILVVILIFVFTFLESSEALENIGLGELLTGTVWRPGTSTGDQVGQFGLVPMILGSLYSTLGAVILGVPLAILTAILLAEVAPPLVREIIRPAVELLAGIPSVIFGLFGVVVLAPMIRNIEIDGNSGFGILNASIILAIMILPTITSVAEDAIRAVPDSYRDASLAMGATHWQTIVTVILPAARSGIIAAIILGIGRALGETMALIMVIGNSIAIPTPLNDNPLTILLATARTLTGNIAVEINYAADVHRSALFFTGVLLFLLLLGINRLAHFVMRERQPS
ncbi:MAG: phosphate ABC transporter permease subunit PstC [Anaerolineae bacterium]|nr:phosphate ABC transporter permease subunit PstC [Anaerolineae bacterium]